MPKREDVAKAKLLLTSPEEMDYFFGRLTSADWIEPLRQEGLIGEPPAPVENGDGVLFPFWPVSRYLVRVAAQAPAVTSDILWDARESRNPRVWWDTVDALALIPPEYSARFIPFIKRWVHHPWRLGLEPSTAALVRHLIRSGARASAIELARDVAQLLPPEGWAEDEPWIPLDDYDFGKELPRIAVELAAFGSSGITPLVEALERFLSVERSHAADEPAADLSFIWRPAIEDHEQNSDHDREAHLVAAIRDGYEAVLGRPEEDVERVVGPLLANEWPVVRRLGLHLLVEHGRPAGSLVTEALTDRALLRDEHHRHELYRLASARYADLAPSAREQFIANVRSVADEVSAAVAARRPEADAELVRKGYLRRWFGAVAESLDPAEREEFEALTAEFGVESHPDFPSYHTSWMGSTSPLSAEQVLAREPEEVLAFLASWEEPPTFGPGDSIEGLAQQLNEAVAQDPARFADTASRYLDLDPAYFNGLVNGLQKAIEEEKSFAWEPVLAACEGALAKPATETSGARDITWAAVRMSVVRLIERGLAERPGQLPLSERDRVWAIVSVLANDPDPTPADEARYGPPNMEPEMYSLNTVRGAAFHAVFSYLLWHHRQAGAPADWSIAEQDPEASGLLDAHLDPERDPSVAVRAAYGWWLPNVLDLDVDWVRDRAAAIVGLATTALDRAGWEAFLFRARGTRLTHDVFAETYAAYAAWLAGIDAKPEARARAADPIERFIDHLVLPWLHTPALRDSIPLRTLLASGKAWLVAEVVEEAGRLISRTPPDDVSPELGDAYQDLWRHIQEMTTNLNGDALNRALSPFAWWFGSPLPGSWTLPELTSLMGRGVVPDPDFVVFRRLPDFAVDHPEMTLRIIERLAERGDEDYSLRVHEGEIRRVIEVSLRGEDPMLRERAEAVIHRLGRLGLGGLGGLLRGPETG